MNVTHAEVAACIEGLERMETHSRHDEEMSLTVILIVCGLLVWDFIQEVADKLSDK